MSTKTIEELRAARTEREEQAKTAAEAHERLCLELEERFITELGPRGSAFEIVNESNTNAEGPIVLKKPDFGTYKLWKTKPDTPEDNLAFVRPTIVYPEAAAFEALAGRRGLMIDRVLKAALALIGSEQAAARGKF